MYRNITEITVTRNNPEGKDSQVVDRETGDEVVAMITGEEIVTLEGFQVRIVEEAPNDGYDIIEVDDDKGIEFVQNEMTDLGLPLDPDIIKMVIDAWHEYLFELGIAQADED